MRRTRSAKQRSRGEYPRDWKEIATAVKEKAGWRCVRCFHPHETPSQRVECDRRCTHSPDGKQRMLTVHHLDMDKANCRPSNLAPLCQICHLQIQGKVDIEQDYMFEHSEWLKPFLEMRKNETRREGQAGWWVGG